MIEPEPLQQIDRTYVRSKNRRLIYFSGCDYFRLASHSKVIAALQEGVENYGLNVAASRLTTGNHVLYRQLESKLADFFAAESAVLVSTGYLTNLVVAQALAGDFTHALIDERAHPSLSDAARFLNCGVIKFQHRDVDNLKRSAQEFGKDGRLVVLTDGMFSHDGSVAPLRQYLEVLPRSALLLVDDAHGAGVLGKRGKGSLEYAEVDRERIIQTATLSKAFGAYGGVILGSAALRDRILRQSHCFVGSTPVPLPLARAALEAISILKSDKALRARLHQNHTYLKLRLRSASFTLEETPGPIIKVLADSATQSAHLSRALLGAGIYPPFIKYPGGPASGYFRFVVSSEHTREQLDRLVQVLEQFRRSQRSR